MLGVAQGYSTIGPVSAADRGNATALLQQTASGSLPSGIRKVVVTVSAVWSSGYNDGYADNLSLVISSQ